MNIKRKKKRERKERALTLTCILSGGHQIAIAVVVKRSPVLQKHTGEQLSGLTSVNTHFVPQRIEKVLLCKW